MWPAPAVTGVAGSGSHPSYTTAFDVPPDACETKARVATGVTLLLTTSCLQTVVALLTTQGLVYLQQVQEESEAFIRGCS